MRSTVRPSRTMVRSSRRVRQRRPPSCLRASRQLRLSKPARHRPRSRKPAPLSTRRCTMWRQARRIAKHAKGPAVGKMQEALQTAGYKLPRYGADGKFGDETVKALKKFQTDHCLKDTGRLDKQTMEQLSIASTKFPEYTNCLPTGSSTPPLRSASTRCARTRARQKRHTRG